MQIYQSIISIIIPAYNAEASLLRTVDSVLNQSYSNFELIIVDDGSEIPVRSYLSPDKDKRIQIIRTKRSNANIARNHGILRASGKYIAMLDADDIWLETHLESSLKLLKTSNADGLYGSLYLMINHNQKIEECRTFIARELKEDESMIDYLLTSGYGAQTSTLFTTMESMKNILWNQKLIDHQDYDFVVRFQKNTN